MKRAAAGRKMKPYGQNIKNSSTYFRQTVSRLSTRCHFVCPRLPKKCCHRSPLLDFVAFCAKMRRLLSSTTAGRTVAGQSPSMKTTWRPRWHSFTSTTTPTASMQSPWNTPAPSPVSSIIHTRKDFVRPSTRDPIDANATINSAQCC